jgi:BirA family biotin operon repressor/biotin-[acetyl-CoA-carboxylase] ligase
MVQVGDAVHDGPALGIAEDGALRVRLSDGERSFHSGEVSVRARPSASDGEAAR